MILSARRTHKFTLFFIIYIFYYIITWKFYSYQVKIRLLFQACTKFVKFSSQIEISRKTKVQFNDDPAPSSKVCIAITSLVDKLSSLIAKINLTLLHYGN